MLLVCPAGNIPAVHAALENGADAIYIGLNNSTNARSFPGLNFTKNNLVQAVKAIQGKNKKVYLALNTYAHNEQIKNWYDTIDLAAEAEVDAIIIADIALLNYTKQYFPDLPIHLSVQASATNWAALNFYQQHFNIKRAVLPRVLSIKQIEQVIANTSVEIEVFGFGSLCIMAEGRCYLSSYLTGKSPNNFGACSPAEFVRWKQQGNKTQALLNGNLIDEFSQNEKIGYPTLCKGRFYAKDKLMHVMEEPVSLNTMELLPQLNELGVKAIKIEGRQRSPAYIANVTKVWREAIDNKILQKKYINEENSKKILSQYSEGQQTTLGAYERTWQ